MQCIGFFFFNVGEIVLCMSVIVCFVCCCQ